jgi:hypothetical protein
MACRKLRSKKIFFLILNLCKNLSILVHRVLVFNPVFSISSPGFQKSSPGFFKHESGFFFEFGSGFFSSTDFLRVLVRVSKYLGVLRIAIKVSFNCVTTFLLVTFRLAISCCVLDFSSKFERII